MNNPYFNLIRLVWHYGKKWRFSIVGYYIAYVIAQAFQSLTPYAFGRAMDELQLFKPENLKSIVMWLFIGVGVEFLFWLFHGPARIVEQSVALELQQTFRLNLYENLTKLPLKWHQNHHSGNVITRINRSALALHRFAEHQYLYIEAIVGCLASTAFLLWVSVYVGLMSIVFSTLLIITVIAFDSRIIPLHDSENNTDNHVGAVLFDYINNMTTVLTLRLGELTHSNLMQRMLKIWSFFRKRIVINEVKWFTVMTMLSFAQVMLLIGYVIYCIKTTGTVAIGSVVMIYRYQYDLNYVFYNFSCHYSEIVRMERDVKSIDPILADIKLLAHSPTGMTIAEQWHNLEIKDLTFSHATDDGRGKVFEQLNFKLKRGEKVALIGTSGGGKSTLLNLLSGLYTPKTIKLSIDEVEFDTLEPLRAITTLIPQDPEIFENTLEFNITLDLPTNIDQINRVIKMASFTDVLNALPEGLNTEIREKGLNFSVGQKQRLALARGLFAARFSSLILMDEPTSSVDLSTEQEIMSNCLKAFPETAIIVSIHRLHLLPIFDSVIMMHNGKIVANGPTKKLLNTAGPVKELWQKYQSGLNTDPSNQNN